ncbi:hypothetical protein [Nonomuraea sp. NPDC001699]
MRATVMGTCLAVRWTTRNGANRTTPPTPAIRLLATMAWTTSPAATETAFTRSPPPHLSPPPRLLPRLPPPRPRRITE